MSQAAPARSGVPGLTATQVRFALVENGWGCLPISAHDAQDKTGAQDKNAGKRPVITGWQAFAELDAPLPSAADIAGWERDLGPKARQGTGIPCGAVVGIDLDILLRGRVEQARALVFEILGETPFRRVGREPRELLVYRAAEPIAIRRHGTTDGDKFEVLAEGAQFVGFGIHPVTRRPYRWVGAESPLTAGPEDAPAITSAQVDALVAAVGTIMPLAPNTAGGHGGGGALGDVTVDETGLVVDGRDAHLTRTVWTVACEIHAEGKPLTVDGLTERAWESVTATTNLSDGAWTIKHVRDKAAALVRKVEAGTKTLPSVAKVEQAAAPVEPTYPTKNTLDVATARDANSAAFNRFIAAAHAHHARGEPAPVYAVKGPMGIGKTREAGETIDHVRKHGPVSSLFDSTRDSPLVTEPWFYLVDTHKLGDQIERRFTGDRDFTAMVWRGRDAWTDDTETERMCLDLEAVNAAITLGVSVESNVCKGTDRDGLPSRCSRYGECAYQRRKLEKPDVWLAAHDMLWHPQGIFKNAAVVVIDENFLKRIVPERARRITVDEFRHPPVDSERPDDCAKLANYCARLVDAVERHGGARGGLRREHIAAVLTSRDCSEAYGLEWSFKPKGKILWPGMSPEDRQAALKAAPVVRHIGRRAAVWEALEQFLLRERPHEPADEQTGQVWLEYRDGEDGRTAVLAVRRPHKIVKALKGKPTLMLNATLPDLSQIRPFFPAVELIADLDVEMPHVSVRYVPDAPTATHKFSGAKMPKGWSREKRTKKREAVKTNVREIHRYVLGRWMELGRPETLVVCQKRGARKLRALGLPPSIHVEHYNALAGLDDYGHVRLAILAGRTMPEPQAMETLAGALTGVQPQPAEVNPATGVPRYTQVQHGLRMRDGTGHPVRGDQHPDPNVEMSRWQACEAEQIQAYGRVRGINRTADNPVQVDFLTNVALPVTVDDVLSWKAAMADCGRWVVTAASGVVLTSPTDMARVFPGVWPNRKAAQREWEDRPLGQTLIENRSIYIRECPKGRVVTYQPGGKGQPRRTAWFDLDLIPDPRAWLEAKLGPLAHCAITTSD